MMDAASMLALAAADDSKNGDNGAIALCASCDRCRSRKTKCDGRRPCSNCAAKYMKKHKVTSIDGIDVSDFECIYSPAKRRGPVPGRSTSHAPRKSDSNLQQSLQGGQQQQHQIMPNADWGQSAAMSSQQLTSLLGTGGGGGGSAGSTGAGGMDPEQVAAFLTNYSSQLNGASGGAGSAGNVGGSSSAANAFAATTASLQQQLSFMQQMQSMQLQQQPQPQQQHQQQHQPMSNGPGNNAQHASLLEKRDAQGVVDQPPARRVKLEEPDAGGIPRTITEHTHLLERNDPEGTRLLAYYKLSIDELFRLPPTPTDEEYCLRLNVPGMTPRLIPGSHLAALSAARFAEAALGAVVHNEVSLAMELCNAVVHCLRESVQEAVQTPIMFEVAKSYFLLGVFRAFRGDMERYFKYRRVCMTYLGKLEADERTTTLIAAISFLDSWAYMVYNANEKALPDVDDTIPPLRRPLTVGTSPTELKYSVNTDSVAIACDPKNKNWIQGAPPVYLNNEAPLHARALDALACAVRTCCDQANCRFNMIHKEAGEEVDNIPENSMYTPTSTAVTAHENELCSRNLVLSAYTLMQSHESSGHGRQRNEGHHLVISAMDAFLENGEESANGGFTDSQIQSLLAVCNTAVENPFLLHHAGPTYHMVSNAAILLCHLMNGMYAMRGKGDFGPMEATMFEEVLDTFISIRKLLTIHRRKLPVKLRCHGIPRPGLNPPKDGLPFIDLGETLLCACRGCQGFVLMACSPCVAAERARSATERLNQEMTNEAEAVELGELDRELDDLGAEFDVDDDALLNMISNLISN